MRKKERTYNIGFHLWINEDNGHFIGKGRVELLEHIQKTGSITHAARAMKMSYRQAWQMVEDMNRRALSPVVEKMLGGKGGGGAIVTEMGQKAIKTFHNMEEKIRKYAEGLSEKIKF
jgi:molybdate transport system regulatory protein